MKLNESWLRERVNPEVSTDELLCQLTMAGLEVEGTEPASPCFSNVVVGLVESVVQHPDADKLKLCSVNDGTETLNVVCGARNVAADMKVAFARVGAKLPGIKIKKAKIRGVESF
ncbi:MAG: phenylalanyl-tRNA synthetase beta chain, partial [Gammaproteobacteria bacterium]